MTAVSILYLLALIFFLLAFLGVSRPPLSWRDAGFACLTATLLIAAL